MRRFWIMAYMLVALTSGAAADTEVEMKACQYTPEVKRELKPTAVQEPKLEKVYSDLAPMLKQIQESLRERDQMRQSGASPETIEKQTQKVIALENQCRERGHELLKPILTNDQYNLVIEMEEVHRRKARERRATGGS